jgi:hypothetical protein
MTDENVAAFPQPKLTIAEILIEGATTDQPEMEMFMRVAEHHPEATSDEIETAMAAAMAALTMRQEAPKPTVDVYWVVHRIVREAFNAAIESGEEPAQRSLINAQIDAINRHPGYENIVRWLVWQALDALNEDLASENGVDLAWVVGSLAVEATQADIDYDPPED